MQNLTAEDKTYLAAFMDTDGSICAQIDGFLP
jgi:hypothetical protein